MNIKSAGKLALLTPLAVLLWQCGDNKNTDTDEIESFELRECIKSASKTYIFKYVDSADSSYLTLSTSVQWPEKLADFDISVLQDTILGYVYGAQAQTGIDQSIRTFINETDSYELGVDFKEVSPDSLEQTSDMIMSLFSDATAKLLEVTEQWVSYDVTLSSYMGGAHPFSMSRPFTFDLKKGCLLTVDNMFKPHTQDRLVGIIKDSLAEQLHVAPGNLTEAGLFSDDIDVSQSVYLRNGMVVFHYNPYEIAPYSMGPIDVEIGPYVLKDIMTEETQALLPDDY